MKKSKLTLVAVVLSGSLYSVPVLDHLAYSTV